ncbi:hemin uptake protein HemP [Sneathiella limimaris]|uniref:hemin uptake protein HemP n=1 Tax=Sneathiella limimaris TaxID=1964213 RepID=UPI00146AB1A9
MSTEQQKSDPRVRQIPVVDNRIESEQIFQSCRQLSILHNGDEYKLQLTGNGKLILTK